MSGRPVKRSRHEAKLQKAMVEWLRVVLLPGSIVHASLNEDASPTQRMINASMGARAGFSDLLVVSGGQHLYLEVKTKTGRQSDAQIEFQRDVQGQGLPYYVVRSIDDVLAALQRHQIRTRIVGGAAAGWQKVRLAPAALGARA